MEGAELGVLNKCSFADCLNFRLILLVQSLMSKDSLVFPSHILMQQGRYWNGHEIQT